MSHPNRSGPPPARQVSGKTIAIVAAAVAAAGALIIGLIVGLSSNDDSATDTAAQDAIGAGTLTVDGFGVPYRAVVSLHLPPDWQVIENPADPERAWLVHSAELVTYDDFAAYIADPPSWPTAESIGISLQSCPSADDYSDRDFDADRDQWQPWEPEETDTMLGRQARSRSAVRPVGDETRDASACLEAVAVDSATAGRPLPTGAQQFLAQLLAGEIVTEVRLLPNAGASTSPSRGR